MFLPATKEEMAALGWPQLDVVLVTGDSYIDSPFIGVAVVGKVLVDAGYRVGVVAQPALDSDQDILRLGPPRLFWGITGGCIDSLVANRTASGRRRNRDDYTAGGRNDRRPDRAVIVYSNLVRRFAGGTAPIVLGGLEASLRRIAHYDFWIDAVRRSILFDARADYLLYGMAERSVVALARCLDRGGEPRELRGLAYVAPAAPAGALVLPAYRQVATDKAAFTAMFRAFYRNSDPVTAQTLAQQQDTRYLVQNPPPLGLSTEELDAVYALDFEREAHPAHDAAGPVRALETIRFSLTTHRGCYGECNFCAIAVHEGRTVASRSQVSIVAEARRLAAHPRFRGTIHDVGGPTANMYGFECERKRTQGCCPERRCLYPEICARLPVRHDRQRALLRALRQVPGVKRVIVASGLRYDLVLADRREGEGYLADVVAHHVSGQLKVAPEHSERHVLALMGKPGSASLLAFRERFMALTKAAGKPQFLTYYMIAAHPGCTLRDMQRLRRFAQHDLHLLPEQVQVFTPTPSTWSTLMYWTGMDPFTGQPCFVERTQRGREAQKQALA